MKRYIAWLVALMFYGSILSWNVNAENFNINAHNVTSDNGSISGFKDIAGDNTGNISGFDNITNTGYGGTLRSGDFITKGPYVDVRAFGTITLGTGASEAQKTANTAAIQAAHDNIIGTGAVLFIPPGKIYTKGAVNISKDRTHIRTEGIHTTQIYSDNGVVFNFDKGGGGTLTQCSIAGVSFVGATTAQKIAIRVTDVSGMVIKDITTSSWTGNTSIGLQYRGRDFLILDHALLFADLPISIEDNPNSTIDIDHAHFSNLYLGAQDNTQANVKIASGVNLNNVLFDGYQSWTTGKHGFYWLDNTSVGASQNLSLNNIRWEQATDTTGWMIYISHNYNLQNLTINNLFGTYDQATASIGTNGIYLRKVKFADIRNTFILSTTGQTSVDFNNTVSGLVFSNLYKINASTFTTYGERFKILNIPDGGIQYAYYTSTTSSDAQVYYNNGVPSWQTNVSVDNGANTLLPMWTNYAGGVVPFVVTVAAGADMGIYVVATTTSAPVLLSGTANMGIQDNAAKINLKYVSSGVFNVNNLSGSTKQITIKVN